MFEKMPAQNYQGVPQGYLFVPHGESPRLVGPATLRGKARDKLNKPVQKDLEEVSSEG